MTKGEFSHIPDDWVTISHEFSGIVEEVGENVNNIQVGDRVGVDPNRLELSIYFYLSRIKIMVQSKTIEGEEVE